MKGCSPDPLHFQESVMSNGEIFLTYFKEIFTIGSTVIVAFLNVLPVGCLVICSSCGTTTTSAGCSETAEIGLAPTLSEVHTVDRHISLGQVWSDPPPP